MKIGIIGLGLMGASFAKVILKKELGEVYGFDISENVLEKAELLNCITSRLTTDQVEDLDMLIYSAYPEGLADALSPYLGKLKKGAVVTDFCGIKRKVVDQYKLWQDEYPDVFFIGGHPMAGREFSGIEHSISTLFDKASMILVPVRSDDIFMLDTIKKFFLSVGFGKVVLTTADRHDEMIAFTSQLCHIVSNNYIKSPSAETHSGYSAGSYRDLTRVARLNPDMWSDLMLENRDYLINELDIFIENIRKYRQALQEQDRATLYDLLQEGNRLKLDIDVRYKNNATKS